MIFRLEELEEEHSQLRREHRDKCRAFDQLQRSTEKLKNDLLVTKTFLDERDKLIAEKGLVIVGDDSSLDEINTTNENGTVNGTSTPKKALVSIENAHMLESAGEGSLGNAKIVIKNLQEIN